MNNELDVFEREEKHLNFKVDPSCKLMPHVLEEYNDKEIRQLYDMYSNDANFDYGLKLNVGDIIEATLTGATPNEYLFDIGYKDYLIVDKNNNENAALELYADDNKNLRVDTDVEILITQLQEDPYIIKGSVAALQRQAILEELEEDEDIVLDALVKSSLPAGFILDINYRGEKVAAFMPNILAGVNKLSSSDSDKLIGKTIKVMIESYTEDKGTFIASRKKYLKSLIPNEIEKLSTKDEKGEYIKHIGNITGTTKYGVFVELSASDDSPKVLTGMIHKDNLEDDFYSLKDGDTITFYIKDILGKKLNLTQIIRESLWDTIEQGIEVEGVVKEFKSFGMLVKFDFETVGLVHNTELDKTDKNYNIGDTIKTKVISVNKNNRKINLSIV